MWTPRPVYKISQKGETHKKSMGVENIIKDVRDNNQIETRKHFDCGDSSLQDRLQ